MSAMVRGGSGTGATAGNQISGRAFCRPEWSYQVMSRSVLFLIIKALIGINVGKGSKSF